MQISNYSQSSFHACRWTESEANLQFLVSRTRNRHLRYLVSIHLSIFDLTNLGPEYIVSLKNISPALRLLVENEIVRLSVWTNPTNDPKRGTDHVANMEKTMLDVSHIRLLISSLLLDT